MIQLELRRLVDRLKIIESIALIPRVASTNLVARRIVAECIENELSLPQAMIIAGEQFAGVGRNARAWSSPPGKGIYATTLLTRPSTDLSLVPLAIANIIVTYLNDIFGVKGQIKWPNDVLVNGKKIAGILIEARIQDDRAFLIVGTGINVEPVQDEARPNAIAISEVTKKFNGVAAATEEFVKHLDQRLSMPFDSRSILTEWRSHTIHKQGDRVTSIIGERTASGEWMGIDDQGRALLRNGSEVMTVSAGEFVIT
jgi:BirA family transcriptional regulator, biotin operon repressor / biotin---[acetyl-CoA-carboxylase] ligase